MTNLRLVKTGIQDVFARIRIMETSAEKAVLRGYAVDHNGVRCNNCRELQHFFKRSDTSLALVWCQIPRDWVEKTAKYDEIKQRVKAFYYACLKDSETGRSASEYTP